MPEDSLEAKLVKTISLIYTLAQFERLKPTKDEIVSIFSTAYTVSEITDAIDNLIEKEFVVYLKRSNNYLRLKQSSGIDIWQKINDLVEANANQISVREILNTTNFDNYLGLQGTGQEVSIMRSTLVRTGLWDESDGMPRIVLHPKDRYVTNMIQSIEDFFLDARNTGSVCFDALYSTLTLPEHSIGLRRGLIPIYLAAAMHEYKDQLLISLIAASQTSLL